MDPKFEFCVANLDLRQPLTRLDACRNFNSGFIDFEALLSKIQQVSLLSFSSKPKEKRRNGYFLITISGVTLAILGTTFAASINLNNSAPVEFGQGVAQTTSCSGTDSLIVTPYSNFDNSTNTFSLTDITISHIPDNCINKDFRISAYSNAAILNLDTDVTIARVLYAGLDTTHVYKGTSSTDTFDAIVSNSNNADGYGFFTLHLTGVRPSANLVQRITIESAPGTCKGVLENNPGESAYQIHQDCPTLPDGLYWIQNADINGGDPVQIYADMTRNGGGWTLIVANVNRAWSAAEALSVNAQTPPSDPTYFLNLNGKYSILSWADYIKRSSSGFEYRLEASLYGHWGGIWTSNQPYSFVSTSNMNTDITRTEKFDNWDYYDSGIEERMPYYTTGPEGLLTTSIHPSNDEWWGTVIQMGTWGNGSPAPWLRDENPTPPIIWYWVR